MMKRKKRYSLERRKQSPHETLSFSGKSFRMFILNESVVIAQKQKKRECVGERERKRERESVCERERQRQRDRERVCV